MPLYVMDRAVDERLTERLRALHAASDGAVLADGRRVAVTTFSTVLREAVAATGYWVDTAMKSPADEPHWPLSAGWTAPTRAGDGEVRELRLPAGDGGPSVFEALEVRWGHAETWRPAADSSTALLPRVGTSQCLAMVIGAVEDAVPDLPAARAHLATTAVVPGGERIRRIRERNAPAMAFYEDVPRAWDTPEANPWVMGALLELAAARVAIDASPAMAQPILTHLVPGAAEVLVSVPSLPFTGPERLDVLTLWEGLAVDGTVASVMLVQSDPCVILPAPQLAWPSLSVDGAHGDGAHGTHSGEPIDRLGGVTHAAGYWTGGADRKARYEEEDDEDDDLGALEITTRLVGRVHFPSKRVHVTDPVISGPASGLLDLELAHPGPYPVFELSSDFDGRGTLILLADGAPARWVRAPLEDGSACWPPIDTGRVAVLDPRSIDRVGRAANEEHHLLDGGTGRVDLLRSEPSEVSDGVLMGAIGGDVGVAVAIGLDAGGAPVALLVDNEDYPGVRV